MKIFISYGHNDYTELVNRLFDALIQAGHQPWKDDRYEGSSGIAPGQDFTEVIYKAIDAADFVIAFVSRCTQDKPYCRDERQYAYNKKGSHFIQIRLDRVEITLGNARSYIDMSDVVDTAGGIYEKLFESSLNAIFAAFRDPESFSEGGITPWSKIDTHLKVPGTLKYHDFMATLDTGDFVGRQWLLKKCKNWAQDASISRRLFVIFGEAGTGKTAFIRHLSRDEELVRSVHVCIYDRPSTRTVRDTLKDLAYVLAHKCADYYGFLKKENLEKLKDMTEDAMFEYLFLEPLKTVQDKYLLIIDGLDELEEASGLKPLMRIFRQYADRINPNISFLVTTRPDEAITDLLKTVSKGSPLKSVTLNKDANKEDLLLYIDRKLQELNRHDTALAQKILDACDGNFEYLSLLFKEAQEEGLQVSDDMPLPRGLNERYIQYLDRHMEARELRKLSKPQRQLLGMLCAAREPIPLSLLAESADLDEDDVLDELELFGSLIHRSEEKDPKVSLFTKSFRDFLLSKDCRRYSADSKIGAELLAQYMMASIRREKDFAKQPYLDRCGFVHLLHYAAEEPDEVVAYIKKLSEKDVSIALRIANALALDTEEAISNYLDIKESIHVHSDVLNFLTGNRAAAPLARIAQFYHNNGQTMAALKIQANLLLWMPSPENIAQAGQLLDQALQIAQQAYTREPCFDSRHAVVDICIKLGDLANRRKTVESLEQAQKWYLEALEKSEQNYREKPCSQSRNSLSISYERLGALAQHRGTSKDLQDAQQWFLKSLELDILSHREKPCYATREDLLPIYSNLGDLAQKKGTAEALEQAQQWFQKVLDLSIENHQEIPCYASRRMLSLAYERIGDLEMDKDTTQSRKEAEHWFLKALELDQQNYREHPSYSSRFCYSIICSRLGGLAQVNGNPEQAKHWFETNLELSLQNHRENPCHDSRQTLSIAYDRLGHLAEALGTPESLAEAEHYYLKGMELSLQNLQKNPSQENIRSVALSYGSLGIVAQAMGTPESLTAAENWLRKALEMNEKLYLDNPCYDSRRDLSITCGKLGELAYKRDTKTSRKEAEKWYLRALPLDEENHRINPCQQSRADLACTYNQLSHFAGLKNTPKSRKQAEEWLLKKLELNLQSHREDPSSQSRSNLIETYEKLGYLSAEKNTKKSRAQAQIWYRKKLELDEQILQDEPCWENRLVLSVTCGILGYLCCQEDTAQSALQAEVWYRKKLPLDEENLREQPCRDCRLNLAFTCERLGDFSLQKNTPDALEEGAVFFQQMADQYTHLLAEESSTEQRQALSRAYTGLSKIAQQRKAPQWISEAEAWMLKSAELETLILQEDPSCDNRFDLSASLDMLGSLALERDTPEALAQAEKWFLQASALDEENYREDPNADHAETLWLGYGRLSDIAKQRNTPESLAEAEKWDARQKELEALWGENL